MLDLLNNLEQSTPMTFQKEGDTVVILVEGEYILGGSSYLKALAGKIAGKLPYLDIEAEKRLQLLLLAAIKSGIINSAHDISDGGLAVTLAECCICGREKLLGAMINLDNPSVNTLFSEAPSRVVVSISPDDLIGLTKMCGDYSVPCLPIGMVCSDYLQIGDVVTIKVDEMSELYFNALK